MILNLIHRYQDHENRFEFQQETAHKLGLKVTVPIPSGILCDEYLSEINRFISDSETYGDELVLWIESYDEKLGGFVWLLSEADKRRSIELAVEKFKKYIGYAPKAIMNYVMDCHEMEMIKEICPEVQTVAAGCFEEGTKVYHGCNNSWYLFSEGMSWNPWYPSKTHALRPAKNFDDWSGFVAVPHLSRDLALAFESRNDFFASHPPNIQRGLVNEGMNHNYDYNIVDQYRLQEDFNDGFSYYQIHVSPSWLSKCECVTDSDEITQQMYIEQLEYMAELKKQGSVTDMTLSEFGEYYRKNVPIEKPTVGVAKEMLFGSGKHYFWIFNTAYRILVDCNQGGSFGDLRPYNGEFSAFTGVDSPMREMHSYPYLIQSQLRTGVKTHHKDGSRTTLFIKYKNEEVDCCFIQSKIESVRRKDNDIILTLTPYNIRFSDGEKLKLQTEYRFINDGRIYLIRKIIDKPGDAEIELREYFKGSYGFTEYPENMKGIVLYADEKSIEFGYLSEEIKSQNGKKAGAIIPQVSSKIEMTADSALKANLKVSEGYLFNPYYTIEITYKIRNEEECITCLNIMKE